MKFRRPRAFTLIEILAVVAVLAILVALSVPALRSSMQSTQNAQDISKLKQIGTAIAAFANDNNGRLPNKDLLLEGSSTGSGQPDRFLWAEAVDRYFDPAPGFFRGSIYNWPKRPNSPFFSKACDPYSSFSPSAAYPLWTRPIAFSYNRYIDDPQWMGYINRIPSPSKAVIVGEQNGFNETAMSPDQPAETRSNVQTRYRVSRPGKTALYLFADYHVESLVGDRGMSYFNANPSETNIWRWW